MRVLNRFRIPLLLLTTVLGCVAPALAGPRHMSSGQPIITEYSGDSNNMPVNCRRTESELLGHARAMSSVRAAMEVFARRGYLAIGAADTAFNLCNDVAPGSVAMFGYRKFGSWIDSNHVAAPMILVITRLNTVNGEPATSVTAGLFVADGLSGRIFPADSLPDLRASDPSFDLVRGGGSGGGSRGRMGTETVGDDLWREVQDPNSMFNRYVRCLGFDGMVCMLTALRAGTPWSAPIKIAALMAQPEIGLTLIYGCLTIAAFQCIQESWR